MGRPWLFLAGALGALANLTVVTPSQAGSTLVTVNSELSTIPSGVTSITELEVTFTGIPPLDDLTLVTPKPSTGATITSVANEIEISIPSAVSNSYISVFDQAFVTFSFTVPGNGTDIMATSTEWVTNSGNVSGQSAVFLTSIPEPASISLLIIGMAGSFGLHRLMKGGHRPQ